MVRDLPRAGLFGRHWGGGGGVRCQPALLTGELPEGGGQQGGAADGTGQHCGAGWHGTQHCGAAWAGALE